MVQLCDTLTFDAAARICADGSLVAEVFAARTGIQDYLGREVDPDNAHGLRDKAVVKVYRPESEVFKRDSLATFAAAPVTVDHPSVAVTADNWRELGVGEINGDVVRDGQRVRVPIIVRDAAAVKAATTTHKQLSMGYSTSLVFPADGKHPDGTLCDAYQTNLKINHIALVREARGGPELRVVDERAPTKQEPSFMSTITIDGLPVNLGDEAAVRAVIAKKDEAIAASANQLTDARTQVSTLTGEKTVLEKQLADAKAALEPAALDARVALRAKLVADAKRIMPAIVTDAMDENAIRRAVVNGKLGDASKDMDDAAIAGAYVALLTGCEDAAPTADKAPVQNIAPAKPTTIADGATTVAAIRSLRYA